MDSSEEVQNVSGLTQTRSETVSSSAAVFLTARPGTALVDTAAAQALMGQKALEQYQTRLATMGKRAIEVEHTGSMPSGTGGARPS